MTILIFDTETTALVGHSALPQELQPRIIEFCGFLIDLEGKTISEVHELVNPGVPISQEITDITKITNDMIASAQPFRTHAPRIVALIEKADAVVAHNLTFDRAMVDFELRRAGAEVKWPKRQICTVEQTEWLMGYRLSLTALHKYLFGVEQPEKHRARADAETLMKCFIELHARDQID